MARAVAKRVTIALGPGTEAVGAQGLQGSGQRAGCGVRTEPVPARGRPRGVTARAAPLRPSRRPGRPDGRSRTYEHPQPPGPDVRLGCFLLAIASGTLALRGRGY